MTTIPVNPRGSMALLQIHSYSSSFGVKEEEKELSRQFLLDLSPAVLFAHGTTYSNIYFIYFTLISTHYVWHA